MEELSQLVASNVRRFNQYIDIIWQSAASAFILTRYDKTVFSEVVEAFLKQPYIRPGENEKFYVRTPLSQFRPSPIPLGVIMKFGTKQHIKCALDILRNNIIVIHENDKNADIKQSMEDAYRNIGASFAPIGFETLADFGMAMDDLKRAINGYLTELFCSNIPVMMDLLMVHNRLSASIGASTVAFIRSNPSLFPEINDDFVPFVMKGGNIYKLQKFILENAAGMPSALSGLSDYDFSISVPLADFYLRECARRYNINLPFGNQSIGRQTEFSALRDAKIYNVISRIFSELMTHCRAELDNLASLGTMRDQLSGNLDRIFEHVRADVFVMPEHAFLPLLVSRKSDESLFKMRIETDADRQRFKSLLSQSSNPIIGGEPTVGYRLLEMAISDWASNRQGVYKETSKTGFKLFRAQLPFNIQFNLSHGISIRKIVFAEMLDYAIPFMYTHDICASQVPSYEKIVINGLSIKSYGISWFIEDVLTMIDAGVASPKHAKRLVRIATLVLLGLNPECKYIGIEELRKYLTELSPRDYIPRDKLMVLMNEYMPQFSSNDAATVRNAMRKMAEL